MPRKMDNSIPPITWTSYLVWTLIAKVEKPVNPKVIFGMKEDKDISAYKTIAETILPNLLRVTYVKHAAALKWTVVLTMIHRWKQNISGASCTFHCAITAKWPFFPNCHRIWATHPNINPSAVTTSVGPHGRCVTFMQPADDGLENIDPVLLAESNAARSSAKFITV
ncbi:hypothetical protein C8R48DRAFT_673954 [Suillus tomentosus]|nr:hypothetical protein C8R48DRAFT_673954 [Suillus tomentosus]